MGLKNPSHVPCPMSCSSPRPCSDRLTSRTRAKTKINIMINWPRGNSYSPHKQKETPTQLDSVSVQDGESASYCGNSNWGDCVSGNCIYVWLYLAANVGNHYLDLGLNDGSFYFHFTRAYWLSGILQYECKHDLHSNLSFIFIQRSCTVKSD